MKRQSIFGLSIISAFILIVIAALISIYANRKANELDKKVAALSNTLQTTYKLSEILLSDTSFPINDTVYTLICAAKTLINTTNNLTSAINDLVVITDRVTSKSTSQEGLGSTVKVSIYIGTQEWMVENLNVTTFNDGTQIPEAKTKDDWAKAGKEGKPAWCFFANNSANGKVYGKLYNWFAVTNKRGLAPKGWHLPNIDEWDKLSNYLGAEASNSMKSTYGWTNDVNGNNGNGNNKTGFSCFPAGIRNCFGDFSERGCYAYFWSTNEGSNENAYFRSLNFDGSSFTGGYCPKGDGFSCRCIKNN